MSTQHPADLPKPCPFCGGVNIIENGFAMFCYGCGAEGPDADKKDSTELVEKWNARAALAQAQPSLTDSEHFAYDPDHGTEFFKTAAEAEEFANEGLKEYRKNAAIDGEWSNDVESIRVGTVTRKATAVEQEGGFDYVLSDAAIATQAAQPEPTVKQSLTVEQPVQAQGMPSAWIRWEWNRSGAKSLVFEKPNELSLREEATGVVYDPLFAAPQAAPQQAEPLSDEQAQRVRAVLTEAAANPGKPFTLPEDAVESLKVFCGIGTKGAK